MNRHVTQGCPPYVFFVLCVWKGGGRGIEGAKGNEAPPIKLEPQNQVMSKLTSKVPNLPGYEQMGQFEILI